MHPVFVIWFSLASLVRRPRRAHADYDNPYTFPGFSAA